ncbi:SMP-30/gluconolactonase/LRE family protein [Simiduia litorea]|uniref:SMP-30/gluconolactonase/LRE family protein n=1 Tax=Simiduia litorea TaxID=1435348 RepID=UPI0036F3FC24
MYLIDEVEVHNGLGECILWDDRVQKLLWTDMPGKRFYRYHPAQRQLENFALPEDLCSFAMIENSDWLLAAFQSGLARYQPESGAIEWFYRLPEGAPLRLNDGRCDAHGRFWVGSLIDLPNCFSPKPSEQGKLYRVDHSGSVSEHLDQVRLSNSLCWSPDNTRLYFSDSTKKCIDYYEFDSAKGELGAGRTLINVDPAFNPDGSVTDKDGYLWNALWGSGKVIRVSPQGQIDTSLTLPVSQPACVTFAGPKLDWLVVSTGTYSLSDAQRKAQASAGNLFIYQTPFTGKLEHRFIDKMSK